MNILIKDTTREERERIVSCLKCLRVPIHGVRPIEEAIITRGGISTKEVSPKTMQSKLVEGLYFAGEILEHMISCLWALLLPLYLGNCKMRYLEWK